MGNTFFCNRCDIEQFKLSQECAEQILTDENGNKLTEEERWKAKLRCLDNVHSIRLGLTEENFNELLTTLEKALKSKETPTFCKNRQLLIECLGRNPDCMLNCKKEMDEFIDCVDALRIKQIKQRIQDAVKKRKLDIDALLKS